MPSMERFGAPAAAARKDGPAPIPVGPAGEPTGAWIGGAEAAGAVVETAGGAAVWIPKMLSRALTMSGCHTFGGEWVVFGLDEIGVGEVAAGEGGGGEWAAEGQG